jgi:hypothetical protein
MGNRSCKEESKQREKINCTHLFRFYFFIVKKDYDFYVHFSMFSHTSDRLLCCPAFPVKVRELLLRCHEIGHVVRGELDDRVLEDLKALPERGNFFGYLLHLHPRFIVELYF